MGRPNTFLPVKPIAPLAASTVLNSTKAEP